MKKANNLKDSTKLNIKFFVLFSTLLFANYGYAQLMRDIYSCNKDQSQCEIYGPKYTIGDSVGVFNSKEELIAVAKVIGIKQSLRTIKIDKIFAKIQQSDQIKFIPDEKLANLEEHYKVFYSTKRISIGGDIGITSAGLGSASSGLSFGAHGLYGIISHLQVGGEFNYIHASGEASDTSTDELKKTAFSATNYIFQAVVKGVYPERSLINLRSEIGVGFAISQIEVDNASTSSKKDILDRIDDGTSFSYSGSLGLGMNFKQINPYAEASWHRIQDTNFRTILLGLSYSL